MKETLQGLILGAVPGPLPPFEIERPKVRSHGELSTNLAMVLAKGSGRNPQEVAREVVARLQGAPLIEKIEVAGAGFINFTLRKSAWQESLRDIDRMGDGFGRSGSGKDAKVLVEFVSANPTGPLHVGNARGGPLGDAIASLLEATGYRVTREYYVNDMGGQIEKLGESVFAAYRQILGETVEESDLQYRGETIQSIAAAAKKKFGDQWLKGPAPNVSLALGRFGIDCVLEEVRKDCEAMGIRFDSWVHEKDVSTETDRVLKELKTRGATHLKEGALWFAPKGGSLEDRESVLEKSDGRPTYFANDIAYHVTKFQRGFEKMVNIWGANHHGHLPRLRAALSALGHDPEKMETVFYQTVRLKRGGEVAAMSKRAGNVVTAREVLEEVGKDAFRFFLLMRAPESHLDFDLELAKRHTQENPVYYVQYAHARLASIFRKAEGIPKNAPDLARLDLPEEIDLIRLLHEFPEEVSRAASRLEPHRIPFYLLELAKVFQAYYTRAKEDPRYRVLSADIDTSRAKLYLAKILQRTIANGLKMIGVSAPEEMQK